MDANLLYQAAKPANKLANRHNRPTSLKRLRKCEKQQFKFNNRMFRGVNTVQPMLQVSMLPNRFLLVQRESLPVSTIRIQLNLHLLIMLLLQVLEGDKYKHKSKWIILRAQKEKDIANMQFIKWRWALKKRKEHFSNKLEGNWLLRSCTNTRGEYNCRKTDKDIYMNNKEQFRI